jgi:ribosomal protein L24
MAIRLLIDGIVFSCTLNHTQHPDKTNILFHASHIRWNNVKIYTRKLTEQKRQEATFKHKSEKNYYCKNL